MKTTISHLEDEIKNVIDQRKSELIAFAGGLKAVNEALEQHKQFMDKAKESLTSEISAGKITNDIANYVLSWLSKSEVTIKDYRSQVRSNNDVRMGEVRAYESVKRFVEALRAEEIEASRVEEQQPVKVENAPDLLTSSIKKRRSRTSPGSEGMT